MASQKGHTSTVDVLLRNGADPNIAKTVSLHQNCLVFLCTRQYFILVKELCLHALMAVLLLLYKFLCWGHIFLVTGANFYWLAGVCL